MRNFFFRRGTAVSPHTPLREFTFAELAAATGGFSDLAGEGGFAKVYRGRMMLPACGNGATGGKSITAASVAGGGGEMRECDVAVRVMKGRPFTGQELNGFKAEVEAMSALNHHSNILRLEGMAMDTEHKPVLVHELIHGGDVNDLLRRVRGKEAQFPWKDRMKVALGCAEALAAIHEKGFIHRDFKTSRVLLRENLTPVVASVGLTRYVGDWERRDESAQAVVGTMGYIDPNYLETGEICQKADTYAFGVFLLELIFGYYPTNPRYQELKVVVSSRGFNDPSLVTDPTVEGEWEKKHVLQTIVMARFATNPNPKKRPPISHIAALLRGIWVEMGC